MNGTIYHMRNTVGALCKNSETMQTIDDPRTFTFDIGDACYATGIKLEQGITYRFNVPDTDLYDGENNHSGPDGYSNWKLFPFVALRRHIAEPWFKLCGKINDGGNETFAVGQGVSEYTARADGELFLYVNDAVFGVLPEWDLPYRWALGHNTGLVKIAISRVARVKNADKK